MAARRGCEVDYGRCVVCQLCVEACPTDAATASFDWAFGTRTRSDLVLSGDGADSTAKTAGVGIARTVSAAACISATSMPAPATAANRSCRRSTIPSTICIGSGSSSRRRRASPICCWSPAPSPTPCTTRCAGPTRRCRRRVGSWRWEPAPSRAASPAAAMPAATVSTACCRSISTCRAARPIRRPMIQALLMFLDRTPQRAKGGRLVE